MGPLVAPLLLGVVATGLAIVWRRWQAAQADAPPVRERSSRADLWLPASVLAGLALAVSLAWERGVYVGDNRFVHYWGPRRGLSGLTEVWNPARDLGGPEPHFHPITDAILAGWSAVGFEPWLVQRLWFALVLFTGAFGVALIVRIVLPSARWEAVLAGSWFVCSPFTTGFFFPTSLLLNVALAPWFVLAVWYGTTTPSRWRWAAVFAGAAAVSGSRNPPGLLLALIPAAVIAVSIVLTRRAGPVTVAAWLVRAGTLSVIVLLPVAIRSSLSAETLARNLGSTESVDAVSLSSSWSESVRGLGFWLHYWNPRGALVRPYLEHYFTNWWVVLATFVPPALAFAVVVVGRGRLRLAFGTMLAVSVALMVGAYPVGAEAPLGAMLRSAYDGIPALFAFRNLYKAAAGLVIAVAVLLAIGAREVAARSASGSDRDRAVRFGGAGLLVAVFIVSGWPLLSGEVLRDGLRIDGGIPAHWDEALSWLDAEPGSGRVLVLPGAASETYRWGGASGGDIFPALLDRPAVFAQPLTGSPVASADVTAALDRALTGGRYEQGTLVPIARRLGIQFVVFRNDFDWQSAGVARPSRLDAVRADPDLELVRTFGRPGDGVARPDDDSREARRERLLPPVEIYRVPGVDDVVRAVGPGPALLVSGAGAGWPQLARSGALDELGPVRWTAQLDVEEWVDELEGGAAVIVTDSNRRRPMPWGQEDRTVTVLDDDRIDDVFGDPSTQSVAEFGDAVRIRYAGPASLFDAGPAYRVAAAFDGDPSTMWLTGINSQPSGQRVRIELDRPTRIDEVRVRVGESPGGRTVTRVAVIVPDVEPYTFDVLPGQMNVLRIPSTVTDLISVAPLEVAGPGLGPFGFAEVEIPSLDLAERIVLPRDPAVAASADARVRSLLGVAPLSFEMQRLVGDRVDVESSLVRRFEVPAARSAGLSGAVQVSAATSPTGIAALVGSPVSVEIRPSEAVASAAETLHVLDGAPATSLALPADAAVSLVVRAAEDDVRDLAIRFDTSSMVPSSMLVRRAGGTIGVDLRWCGSEFRSIVDGARVSVSTIDESCVVRVVWSPADPAADEVGVALQPVERPETDVPGELADDVVAPTRIESVEIEGVMSRLDLDGDTCRSDLVTLDGTPVPVRLAGSIDDLIAGIAIPVEACDRLEISGWHELRVAPGVPIDWLRVAALDGNEPVPVTDGAVTVLDRSFVDHEIMVDGPAGSRLILGQAHSEGWTATAHGSDLGRSISLDAQAGWVVPDEARVEVTHVSQNLYWRVTLLSLAVLCLLPAVIIADPRRSVTELRPAAESSSAADPSSAAEPGRRRSWATQFDLAAVGGASVFVFAFLVGGVASTVVAACGALALRRRWLTATAIGLVAALLTLGAALFSVPPLGPSLAPVWPLWPSQRGLAHEAARLAVVLSVVAIWSIAAERSRPDDRDAADDPDAAEDPDAADQERRSDTVRARGEC